MNKDVKKKKPLISVIIPTYNREKLLSGAIDSVLKQIYTNWELLIVDDRSSDATEVLVKRYGESDPRIRYLKNQRSQGPSGARNWGIINARGEFFAFLDSDDEWFAHHLSDSISILENENVSVCFAWWIENRSGKLIKVDELPSKKKKLDGAIEKLQPRIKNNLIFFGETFYEYALTTDFYCCHLNTMVLAKTVIQTVSLFNETLRSNEDTDFINRVFHDFEFCLIRDHHFLYNEGQDNLYLFIDRTNIDIDTLIENEPLIKKLTFHGVNGNKSYRASKKFIKKSTRVKDKKKCLKIVNRRMARKYFTLGYINQKTEAKGALFFLLVSLAYGFKMETLHLIAKMLFPFWFVSPEVDPSQLDLG